MKRPNRHSNPVERRRWEQQRAMNRQLRVWTPRRVLGWGVIASAVVMAIIHWLAHLDVRMVPIAMGWQDLLLGYPMAMLLLVIGALVLGLRTRHSGTGR